MADGSLVPSIIGAAGGVAAAIVSALVVVHERRNKILLRKIRNLIETSDARTIEAFKEGIREVLGTHGNRRRWYER